MNKKKKWASILTIATSLVLCIISTFGITLAFFGGNASANLSTITLKTGIEIGAAIESSVGSAKVVPGQPVKIEATGTIEVTDKGTPTEANAVNGVVRAKLTVGDELGDVEISGESDYWTAGGDGYYYLVTAQGGSTLRVVKVGDSVKLFGNLTVSKNFTNADSGKSVEASVIFEVIQAGVYDSVTGNLVDMTVANATSASSPLYASFSAVKYKETLPMYGTQIQTAYYNEDNIADSLPSGALMPYAVVDRGATVDFYWGFNMLESDYISGAKFLAPLFDNYSNYPCIGSVTDLVQYGGSINGVETIKEFIQDGTFVVKNASDYVNSQEWSSIKDGGFEFGPVIYVANFATTDFSLSTMLANINSFALYVQYGVGGSN